jgi:hypothetical protein
MQGELFADTEAVITAISTAIAGVITGIAGAWAMIHRTKKREASREAETKIKAQQVERKDSLDECWKLDSEVKDELQEAKNREKELMRRIRRLERIMMREGINLPDLSDHENDESTDVVIPIDKTPNPGQPPKNQGNRRPPNRPEQGRK